MIGYGDTPEMEEVSTSLIRALSDARASSASAPKARPGPPAPGPADAPAFVSRAPVAIALSAFLAAARSAGLDVGAVEPALRALVRGE